MVTVVQIRRSLTEEELDVYSKRIDEISDLFDLELEDDILNNLQNELEDILHILSASLIMAQAREHFEKQPRTLKTKKIKNPYADNVLQFKAKKVS